MNKIASIRDVYDDGSTSARTGGAARDWPAVRPDPFVPLVMIMAKGDEVDDQLRELARQIAALVDQRTQASDLRATIEVDELRIEKIAHRVTVAGEEIRLTGLEFRLLVQLAERGDSVQSRGALLRNVWDLSAHNQTRTVDTHVKRLRDKLKSAGRFIKTVRGSGYRFAAVAGGAEWAR
jgi:two-component system, OmpR family, phosphate regulon response regulator PhoB